MFLAGQDMGALSLHKLKNAKQNLDFLILLRNKLTYMGINCM